MRCCDLLRAIQVDLGAKLRQILRKSNRLASIRKIKFILQRNPRFDVRLIVLNQSLHFVERLVQLCLQRFLCRHLRKQPGKLRTVRRQAGFSAMR